jgi:hypothetical protein
MKPSPRLGSQFEALEDRSLPSDTAGTVFGVPWADPEHITISFVADGTQTPFGPSTLNQTLGSAGSAAAWEREILRAFQTWAAATNVNIGVVADGGQALGTVGAVQGDSRFGDIRIAAAPMSSTDVASASPFSWTGTTLSGDVVLNSNDSFTIGNSASAYDIYSVMVHEAGHVFGLDHSAVPGAVMNENYSYHTGLGGDDVARIQALYGAPQASTYGGASGNTTLFTAASIPGTSSGQLLTSGDLTAGADVNYYKFSTPLLTAALSGVAVRLKTEGLSLLNASVTVFNSFGLPVAYAKSTDPLNNDLTLTFNPGLFGGTYYVMVTGASTNVFEAGGYKLAVDFLSLNSVLAPITTTVAAVDAHGLTGTLATALGVQSNPSGTDSRFDAVYRGVIDSSSDVDTYRIGTNKYAAGTSVTLDVMVWGLNANPLDPQVRVYDAAGNPVAFQVLSNDRGLFTVQVLNAVAGQNYYVQVFARAGAVQSSGSYFFAADFNQIAPLVFGGVGGGTVQPGGTDSATLTLNQAALFQFALGANSQHAGDTITMTVYDANGNVVFALTAVAGQPPVTATRYLKAGTYTIRYSAAAANAAPVGYGLFMLQLSDPVGPYATSTASPSSSTAPSTGQDSLSSGSSSSSSTTSNSSTSSSSSSASTQEASYNYSGSSTYQPSGYYYTY